jgi:hypothetical protein
MKFPNHDGYYECRDLWLMNFTQYGPRSERRETIFKHNKRLIIKFGLERGGRVQYSRVLVNGKLSESGKSFTV